jgi:hypothetical protein
MQLHAGWHCDERNTPSACTFTCLQPADDAYKRLCRLGSMQSRFGWPVSCRRYVCNLGGSTGVDLST